jgi:mannose-6-phosphate isomerase-like protein (cupin superfamily)
MKNQPWRVIIALILLISAIPQDTTAQQEPLRLDDDPPTGFVMWPSAEVETIANRLEREIGNRAMVYETIRNDDGHSVYFVLRGLTGPAEFHETEADLYVVHRGNATFVIGGELINAELLPRKQQRGSSIRNGIRHALAPGDILHVPVATPHQIIIPPGQTFLYTLVKFNEEPLQ